MKRWMLLVALVCLCLSVQAFGAEEPSVYMTAESGVVGDIVKVSVYVENNPGITAFSLVLDYNETALAPVSYATPTAGFTPGATYNASYDEGVLSYFFQSPYGLTSQGEMVTFEFEILRTTVCGYSTVRMGTLANNPTFVLEDGTHVNYEELPTVQAIIYETEAEDEGTVTDSTICVTCIDDLSVNTNGGISVVKNNSLVYVNGYEDDTFAPDEQITRAEVAVMFSRILSPSMVDGRTYDTDFTDMTDQDWYANAVGYLTKYGLISGYEDGSFGGDLAITRAEFAVLVSRVAPLVVPVSQQFSDVDDSYWAASAINYGAYMGWLSGYENRTFQPEQAITRAEAVCILNRILERSVDDQVVETGFVDVPTSHWASQEIRIATQGVVVEEVD